MFQILATLLSLVAVILAFVAVTSALIPLGLGVAGVLFLFVAVRSRRFGPVTELSPAANVMLAKFGHFYAMPYAGRDVSGATSALALGAMIVGAISLFKTQWWVAGGCAVVYLCVAPLGRQFNPSNFLTNDLERAAHEEIIAYINEQASQA